MHHDPLRSFATGRYRVVQSSHLNSLREITISKCERCGTELKIIDSIEDAELIELSLVHLQKSAGLLFGPYNTKYGKSH